MAKIGFTKLGLKPNNEIQTITFNEQLIEVKQYLSVEDKLELISTVIELSHDQNNFANPIKIQVYASLEIIERYTNISFTEKQKENPVKLYDLLNGNGLIKMVIEVIPQEEYDTVIKGLYDTVDAIYTYQNSVMGILENVSQDYNNLNFDATELQKKIADPESIALLKSVLTKLG